MASMFRIKPLTLKQANEFVLRLHRHHKPVRGHRFSIGLFVGDECVGAAIVGRPVARMCPAYDCAEVTRLVTNGYKNACSALYGACARICKEMGFEYIQTYILETEYGASLKASGWVKDATTPGGDWNSASRKNRRTDQPMGPKTRYRKILIDTPR